MINKDPLEQWASARWNQTVILSLPSAPAPLTPFDSSKGFAISELPPCLVATCDWRQRSPSDLMVSLFWPLQKIFGEFLTVEMSFHAKALEVYTLAYQSIQSVDEEEDLEVGKRFPPASMAKHRLVLRTPPPCTRLTLVVIFDCSKLTRPLLINPLLIHIVCALNLDIFFCLSSNLVWEGCDTILRDRALRQKTKYQSFSVREDPLADALCAIFLHPSPSHLCVFALNHLPSVHIETKLFIQTRLFFGDSLHKAWEIESSAKGTMTGMKIILIKGPRGTTRCGLRCLVYLACFASAWPKQIGSLVVDLPDIPEYLFFVCAVCPETLGFTSIC